MPPKRKARPSVVEEDPPPAKRAARAREILAETQAEANGSGRVTRSRSNLSNLAKTTPTPKPKVVRSRSTTATPKAAKPRGNRSTRAPPKSPTKVVDISEAEEPVEEPIPVKPAKRGGRPPGIPARKLKVQSKRSPSPVQRPPSDTQSSLGRKSAEPDSDEDSVEPAENRKRIASPTSNKPSFRVERSPSLRISPATSSKVTLEQTATEQESDADSDEDPLLLTDKRPRPRLVTPVRTITTRAASTPRHILEVVVNTPSRRTRNLAAHHGSPSVRESEPPVAVPLTPPKPSVKPTDDLTRSSSLSPVSSESRDKDIDNPPLSSIAVPEPSSPKGKTTALPFNPILPLHHDLHPCLHAQKCAVLKALRTMPVMDPEVVANGEGRDATTNDIAFEQLRNLLRGTVDRGEGNSCFLTGPRGSGKTQVWMPVCEKHWYSHIVTVS